MEQIRKARKDEFENILELHQKQAFDYRFPDQKEIEDLQVVVDENDKILMVLAARKVIEYNLLVNPDCNLSPFVQHNYIRMMAGRSIERLKKKNYKQVFAFIPPEIVKSFGRRLIKMGGRYFTWPVMGKDI